ncbi:hypothetical protein [Streptomyces murinus]|uniref:WXG100 family type VII secretion target n=1 Tax=Streptomyces murinus TaxID=33900 RepID=UPI002E10658C|nr:hypothetical protein OG516_27870 [Streptomyces murinus]
MGGNWQNDPRYKSDFQQVDQQASTSDALGAVRNFFRSMPFGGRTEFDDHDLNAMLDLVEHADPEQLETAGKALWDARNAISDASKDLHACVKTADWEGEGADAFKSYAKSLFDWTSSFGDYTQAVGTQITTAATGLASVRKSMPPRDTRPAHEQKRPWLMPKADQKDTNPDYTLAQKVEKHRQEAINQMNRLGSYYSVSAGEMQALQEPPITQMPTFGVPQPTHHKDLVEGTGDSAASTTPAKGHEGVTAHHQPTVSPNDPKIVGHTPSLHEAHQPTVLPGHSVGTEINTVGTLPPQAPVVPHGTPAPTLPTASGGGGQPPLTFPGPVGPAIPPTAGRSIGYSPNNRFPASAQERIGRAGTASGRSGLGNGRVPESPEERTGTGRAVTGGRAPQEPMGQAARTMGRTGQTGRSMMRGAAEPSERSPIGRAITGGTPRPTGTSSGRGGVKGPTSAMRNGVLGGKPVTERTSGGASGPKVPRGTVVGAEESVPSAGTSPKGAVGQRGVVGAPAAKSEPGSERAVLRSASNPEGVVGAPRSGAGPLQKGAQNGAGDRGLGRGAVGGKQGPKNEAGHAEEPTEKNRHRLSRKRRRDAQKSD